MQIKRKVTKLVIIKISLLSLSIIILFCVLQIIDYSVIRTININDLATAEDIEWHIDTINIDRYFIAITGWAYPSGKVPNNVHINIVLENIETKEAIVLPTVLVDREDLEEISLDGYDNSQCGFVARVMKYLINFNKKTYKILIDIKVREKNYIINTNQILNERSGE